MPFVQRAIATGAMRFHAAQFSIKLAVAEVDFFDFRGQFLLGVGESFADQLPHGLADKSQRIDLIFQLIDTNMDAVGLALGTRRLAPVSFPLRP